MYVLEKNVTKFHFDLFKDETGDRVEYYLELTPGHEVELGRGRTEYVFEGLSTIGDQSMVNYRCPTKQEYGTMNIPLFIDRYVHGNTVDYTLYNDAQITFTEESRFFLVQGCDLFRVGHMCFLTDLRYGLNNEPVYLKSIDKITDNTFKVCFDWLLYDRQPIEYNCIDTFCPYVEIRKTDDM